MPPSRRSEDNFDKHFTEAGLFELVTFRKAQQNTRIKKKLRGEIGTEVLYCIYGPFYPFISCILQFIHPFVSLFIHLMCVYPFILDDYLEKDTETISIIEHCQEVIEASTLSEVHVVVLIWNSIMGLPDWSKREDLLVDQLEHHLEVYGCMD